MYKLIFSYLTLAFICLNSNGQISSKSKVQTSSTYTEPFNLQLFEKIYKQNQGKPTANSTISDIGVQVIRRYKSYKQFPSKLPTGQLSVYAVGKRIDNIPFSCYEGLAKVEFVEDGYFITQFMINGLEVDFELSEKIQNCKTNILWKYGRNSIGEDIYCGFDVYFLDVLENYSSGGVKTSTPKANVSNGNEKIYDGYQIVDFAKQVKFKPKNYSMAMWEKLVIGVFASGENSDAASKQINIEASYLYSKQPDLMYRRYTENYGFVGRDIFNQNHQLYIILLKTDELKKD